MRGGAGFGSVLFDPRNVTISSDPATATMLDSVLARLLQNSDVDVVTAGGTDVDNGDWSSITITGADLKWNAPTRLTLKADNDIVVSGYAALLHSEARGDGGQYITRGGGIVMRAKNNILVGTSTDVGDAAYIRIGSEFGTTEVVAGDTDWNGVTDAETGGAVTIGGGVSSVQIGFDTASFTQPL
ncbi:MAG: hypothetical protein EBU97_06610, partial [Rhodobacteraceae bacterium]|nr:hypothetical protein [Paracoccaceae bacterium]